MRRLALLPLLVLALVVTPTAAGATLKATILKAPDASSSLAVTVKVPAGWKAKAKKTSITFSGAKPALALGAVMTGRAIARGGDAATAEGKLRAAGKKSCGKKLASKNQTGRGWTATVYSCGRLTMFALVVTRSAADLGGADLLLGSTSKPSAASAAAVKAIIKGLRVSFLTASARRAPSVEFVALWNGVSAGTLPPRVREEGAITPGGYTASFDAYYDVTDGTWWDLATPAGEAPVLDTLVVGGTGWVLDTASSCYLARMSPGDTVPSATEELRSDLGYVAIPQLLDSQADVTAQLTQSYDFAPVDTALDGSKTLRWTSFGLGAAALVSTTTLGADGFPTHVDAHLAPYLSGFATFDVLLDFTTPDSLPAVPSPPSPICP